MISAALKMILYFLQWRNWICKIICYVKQGSVPASAGARFMTELLVWSLLGGGGLRDALKNALQAHSTDAYNHLVLDE